MSLKKSSTYSYFALTAVAAAMLSPSVTSAQDDGSQILEEIIVTAQKREQSLQEVPLAVTVLGKDQIDSSFGENIEALQALVPSVSFRTGNTTRNSALTVRGIGTISFSIGAEPSVSTVVDGVVLGRSGQAFGDLYDLERVEVLRGPQGTLFGKNASAGVVNLTTKKPSDEFEGYVQASVFEDSEYILKGRVAGPISEKLRGSLTAFTSEFDGYIRNVFNGEDVNGYDKHGFRAMLDYQISDVSNLLFIVEDYDASNDCCADLEARPSGRNPNSPAAPRNGSDLDLDQRLVDHDFETRTLDSTTAASMTFNTEFANHEFTSITAVRNWDNTEFREGDFTSIAGDSNLPVFGVPFQLHDVGPQEWKQFSQELRLTSISDGPFQYQLGAFYWDIDSERSFTRDASCQNNNGQLNAAIENHLRLTLGDATTSAADFIAANGITCNANDIVSATANFDTKFENFAVFGDGSYAFNDQFKLLFGLRYTDDELSFNHVRRNNDVFGRRGVGVRPRFSDGNNQFDTNFSGSTSETDLSGKLGLEWAVNDTNLLYYTYSTGYKGPAFNVFFNLDSDDILPINPEQSEAHEIGWKFSSNNLILNMALYSTEFEDFQANDFDASDGTTVTGFTNGGDVETEGVEVDFIWQVSDNFQLTGGLALSSAETTLGDELPFAPDTKYTVMGDYNLPLANGATLNFNSFYTYTDEQLSGNIGQDAISNPVVLLPDYGILTGSVSYITPDGRFKFSLVGKNLTDESYATTFSGDGFRYQIPRGADRVIGVSVSANF
ncbi:MAG: TonB-dependent receptor [Acidiferrobacterales bacterium]|nr:TonB-dependent receptor [Acidiferrobacterales bacterium]